jgi:hypothetical protein
MDVGSGAVAYLAAVHMHFERVVLKKEQAGTKRVVCRFCALAFSFY